MAPLRLRRRAELGLRTLRESGGETYRGERPAKCAVIVTPEKLIVDSPDGDNKKGRHYGGANTRKGSYIYENRFRDRNGQQGA